jgi:putative glycosyltransferase (TIGR04348 family)
VRGHGTSQRVVGTLRLLKTPRCLQVRPALNKHGAACIGGAHVQGPRPGFGQQHGSMHLRPLLLALCPLPFALCPSDRSIYAEARRRLVGFRQRRAEKSSCPTATRPATVMVSPSDRNLHNAMARISLITPAKKQSRAGNRTTAVRWARILQSLGHRVRVAVDYQGEPADLMVALHAWRSAASIRSFRDEHPQAPLVVALTGTDIYRFLDTDPELTLSSLALADVLVCLHNRVNQAIPERFADKLQVIYQSALPLSRPREPSQRFFDVCVIGHLREEKDPLRAALAVRDLPPSSRIRVIHLGKAHHQDWAVRAEQEMARNPRYIWRGEVPRSSVRRAFAKAQLMVLSSIMEGGANVISEAVVAGVPVIASDIPGSVGLLGDGYPGYYPVEDTAALRRLLRRSEQETSFLTELAERCASLSRLFMPEAERESWHALLDRLL